VSAYFVQGEHWEASSNLERWLAKPLSHYHYAVVVLPPDELPVKLPFDENYAWHRSDSQENQGSASRESMQPEDGVQKPPYEEEVQL
jgi:hypothetical protein